MQEMLHCGQLRGNGGKVTLEVLDCLTEFQVLVDQVLLHVFCLVDL